MNQKNKDELKNLDSYIKNNLEVDKNKFEVWVEVSQFSEIAVSKYLTSTSTKPSKIMFISTELPILPSQNILALEFVEIFEPKEKLYHVSRSFLESTKARLLYPEQIEMNNDYIKLTNATLKSKLYRYGTDDMGEPLGLILEIPYLLSEENVRLIGWVWRSEKAKKIEADGFRVSLLNHVRKDKKTVISFVHPWNLRSISLHRKLGFKEKFFIYRK